MRLYLPNKTSLCLLFEVWQSISQQGIGIGSFDFPYLKNRQYFHQTCCKASKLVEFLINLKWWMSGSGWSLGLISGCSLTHRYVWLAMRQAPTREKVEACCHSHQLRVALLHGQLPGSLLLTKIHCNWKVWKWMENIHPRKSHMVLILPPKELQESTLVTQN